MAAVSQDPAIAPLQAPQRRISRQANQGVVAPDIGVYLYWIPLGAGGHFVRFNGKVFEAIAARRERRPRRDLFHSALDVRLPEGRSVIEMAWPIPKGPGTQRGSVGVGPVGWKWAGRFRISRYEIRCWLDGRIPDLDYAVGGAIPVSDSLEVARRVVALAPFVPKITWGRDELHAGEMWNSNSCISWLLDRSGVDATRLRPPFKGRAPGWDAGLVASRQIASKPATPTMRCLQLGAD